VAQWRPEADNAAMKVQAVYVSPVKSLALNRVDQAQVTKRGIAGDRAFFIVDERGKVFTQRECPPIVTVAASYDAQNERLQLTFPDLVVESHVALGDAVKGEYYNGRAVLGPFDDALSAFAGQAVRLAKVDDGGYQAFDGFPLSLCSDASVARVREAAAHALLDERRFRQNIFVAGADEPHEEDTWLGREIAVGDVTLRVKMRDPRCVITTRDPDTGEHDVDTLKIIASYRTDQPKEVNFGVYCTVVTPGTIRIGDEVRVVAGG
jgi:uncharacterized protein YcbX